LLLLGALLILGRVGFRGITLLLGRLLGWLFFGLVLRGGGRLDFFGGLFLGGLGSLFLLGGGLFGGRGFRFGSGLFGRCGL
jgi:hypothetical protein